MVMEAPPSPQSVGREFVRQYYTLLNKAPSHLHRFYNHQSSFVHGGLDPHNRSAEAPPVIGQKQIHQAIQQLNFRDCHAKITQVDSQATLGNGVVVQVTGELSNGGQPMRRFTQTFVLAAQSPKKYYVHNDIFRYQDEVFSDEECDGENRSENEEDVVAQDRQPVNDIQPIAQQPLPFYPQPSIPPVALHHNQAMNVLPPQAVAQVNGTLHPEELAVMPGQVPHVTPGQGLGNLPAIQPPLVPQPHVNAVAPVEENSQPIEEPVDDNMETAYTEQTDNETEPQDNIPSEPAPTQPKTYATLLKSGNNGYNSSPQVQSATSPQQEPRAVSPPQGGSLGHQGLNQRSSINRGPRISQQRPRQDSIRGRTSMSEDDDRRRPPPGAYGDRDINQLFLGNIPQTASEEELKDIFSEFGSILDLRVHSKPPNKNVPPGTRATPNYGFITYETQQGVQNCLLAKPIYYPKDDQNGTQLNVEEKKNKERPSFGGRLSNDNRPRGENMQRRGIGGPGGPNRSQNSGGGGPGGGNPPPRNNSYNRGGGPPRDRGLNPYNNRR